MKTIPALLLALSLTMTGCIGAALSARGKISAHDREAFAKANAEREAAGLPPLTKKQFMNMEPSSSPRVITTTTSDAATETTSSSPAVRLR